MRKLAIAGLSAAALLALPVTHSNALSIQPQPVLSGSQNLVEVNHRGGGQRIWRRGGNYNNWNGGNWRGGNWRGGKGGNWNHNHHHGGHHNNWDDDWWWGPAAGFGLGLVLGAAPRYYDYPVYRTAPRVGVNASHVAWCENRYRSYRAWDNTFQPYRGPRQQCVSPYI